MKNRVEVRSFATQIRILAQEAPDPIVQKDLHRAAHRLFIRHALPPDEKKRLILRAVESGCSKADEIRDETGLSEADMNQYLPEMVREESLRVEHSLTGGPGRPSHYYFVR